jgi:hypothetical protein
MHSCVWSENLKGRDHSEDIDLHGGLILKCIFREVACQDMDWLRTWPCGGQLMNTVINLQVS